MARWLARLFLLAALAGCERDVFDHTPARQAQRVDGGGAGPITGPPSPAQCEDEADGARCDDWDPCTPSSTCRGGECMPGNVFGDCTIADSDSEFGHSQGENDWFYGYYGESRDDDGSYDPMADFALMDYCGADTWRPPEVCGLEPNEPGFRWTQNLAWGLQHPETSPGIELPIRRWVSDVSGPATMQIAHKTAGVASDGTRALLLFDGHEVWRHVARGGDPVAATVTMPVELHVGMVIDQLVHPLADSADDTTYFTIRIEGR